jgi:hypothetical protein
VVSVQESILAIWATVSIFFRSAFSSTLLDIFHHGQVVWPPEWRCSNSCIFLLQWNRQYDPQLKSTGSRGCFTCSQAASWGFDPISDHRCSAVTTSSPAWFAHPSGGIVKLPGRTVSLVALALAICSHPPRPASSAILFLFSEISSWSFNSTLISVCFFT